MNDSRIIGINEPNLKKLILEIYEYRDKISKVLNTAESLIYDTANYYKSEDGDELRKKFDLFSSNFDVFLKNIQSYGEDLEQVIYNYRQNALKNVDIFKK